VGLTHATSFVSTYCGFGRRYLRPSFGQRKSLVANQRFSCSGGSALYASTMEKGF